MKFCCFCTRIWDSEVKLFREQNGVVQLVQKEKKNIDMKYEKNVLKYSGTNEKIEKEMIDYLIKKKKKNICIQCD